MAAEALPSPCGAIKWATNFEVLRAYMDEYDRSPPQKAVYLNVKIGQWCNDQRMEKMKGVLDPARERRLVALPLWQWEPIDPWSSNFDVLLSYMGEYGRCPPAKDTHQDVKIGQWCDGQRRAFAAGSLRADHVAKLGALPKWRW